MNAQRSFELSLDREKAGRIQTLLFSPAWIEDFTPEFREKRESAIALLLDPSQTRKDQVSDDYLRARVQLLDELLALGHSYLAEYEVARQQEQQVQQALQEYQARADMGQFAPMPMSTGY